MFDKNGLNIPNADTLITFSVAWKARCAPIELGVGKPSVNNHLQQDLSEVSVDTQEFLKQRWMVL